MKCVYVTCIMIILTCVRRLTATVVQTKTVTYTTTTLTIDCPITQALTLPSWIGPPGDTIYTEENFPDIYNTDRTSYASNKRSLILNNTQIADAGTYKCIKIIDGVIEEGWNILEVRIRPNDPTISGITTIKGRQSILGTEGISQTLTCTSTGGYPAPTVVWYRGTTELTRNSSGSLDGTTYTVVLTHRITPSRTDDRQSCICQSYYPSSEVGSQDLKTNTAELYLNLKPAVPAISTVGSPVSGETSQTIARCVTSGFRPSTSINMTMSFRGVTNAYTTAVEDTTTETYSITADYNRAVQTADNGRSLTCSVTHQTLPTPISQSVAIDVKFTPTSVSLTGSTSVVANGNNKMTFTCTTRSSNPASNIAWTYDVNGITKPIQDNGGSYNGRVTSQQLELTPTRDDDGKTVTCSASNTVNINTPVTSETKTLTLQYHPIATLSGPTPVTEGDENVVLNCSAHSRPLSAFTWYHNNINTPLSGASAANNVGLYRIQKVSRTDYGTYKCRASNNISPASEPTMALSVKFAPVSASVTGNTNIVADGINKMYLTCTSGTSNPASSIVWKRQDINIINNRQLQLRPGNYGGQIATQILELTPTRDMYGHNVTCEADNGITGQSAAIGHIKLEIRYSPELTTWSQPADLKEGVSSVTLTCAVSSKPDSTIKWYKDGITNPIKTVSSASSNNVLVHTIQHVQRSHAGGYTCSANNNIRGDVTSKVQVVVQYAPDVTVTTKNVSVNDSHVDILCSPSGVPSSYTYQPWTQAWTSDGRTVPLQTELGNSPTLRLTYLSYQHSGVYTCRASNGVTESINDNAGQGNVHINVESFPIITEPVVSNGQYHKVSTYLDVHSLTNISVQYYSNAGAPTVSCYKLDNNTRRTSNIYTISSKSVVVQLPVFAQRVNTNGTMATVTMAITHESQLGFYVIVIRNNRGENIVPVQIVSEDKPESPTSLRHIPDLTTDSTLTIKWTPGINGGLVQTYKIEYRETSYVQWIVKTVQEPATNITLDSLSAGTIYEVRISAYNALGTSRTTEIEAFKTAEIRVPSATNKSKNTGLLVGTFVGNIALTLIIIAAILILRRQRNIGTCTCLGVSNTNNQHIEDPSKDQNEYYNMTSTVGPTDEIISNEPDCDTGTTTYESTISSNPKEHVYTDLQAHSQGVSKTQKGMKMYENLKIQTGIHEDEDVSHE